jgi:hypothetical protein
MHGIFQKWRKNRARYLNNSGRSSCETDVRELFRKSYVIVAYAPVATILFFGLIGVTRGRFGRVIATFTFITGLVALGLAALIMSVSVDEAGAEGAALGSAIYMMFASGVLASLSGLITLFSPERGKAAVASSQLEA